MFKHEIINLNKSYDAIKTFIDLVEPVLEEKQKENFKRDREDLRLLDLLIKSSKEETDASILEKYKTEIEESFDGEFKIEEIDGGVKLSVNGKDGDRFNKALKKIHEMHEQKQILYKSCLMNIISAAECYFADLLKTYFNTYPDEIKAILIKANDKYFSYNQLSSYDTMEDARNYIIDSKIDGLIRSNFSDWIEFLKQKMGLNMGYLKEEESKMYEVFLRRNLFVHNDGVINSVYLTNVDKNLLNENQTKEELIHLQKDYLLKNIDFFETTFLLMGLELWKKKKNYDESRYEFIAHQIYRNMDSKRWELVKSFTIFLINEGQCPIILKNMAKINKWLSYKMLGKFEEIRKEVEQEDFSACTKDFMLCKNALLDKKDKVFEILNLILKADELTVEKLEKWPVLDAYRDDENYQQIINKYLKKDNLDKYKNKELIEIDNIQRVI